VERNRQRDRRTRRKLRACGWRVVSIWEHALRRSLPAAVARVLRALSPSR
jgi:G:T-mismatch repair DNA endonuclease (very short patch repair protein)